MIKENWEEKFDEKWEKIFGKNTLLNWREEMKEFYFKSMMEFLKECISFLNKDFNELSTDPKIAGNALDRVMLYKSIYDKIINNANNKQNV